METQFKSVNDSHVFWNKPVLPIVDFSTHLGAATFLIVSSADETWVLFLLCWVSVDIGYLGKILPITVQPSPLINTRLTGNLPELNLTSEVSKEKLLGLS